MSSIQVITGCLLLGIGGAILGVKYPALALAGILLFIGYSLLQD